MHKKEAQIIQFPFKKKPAEDPIQKKSTNKDDFKIITEESREEIELMFPGLYEKNCPLSYYCFVNEALTQEKENNQSIDNLLEKIIDPMGIKFMNDKTLQSNIIPLLQKKGIDEAQTISLIEISKKIKDFLKDLKYLSEFSRILITSLFLEEHLYGNNPLIDLNGDENANIIWKNQEEQIILKRKANFNYEKILIPWRNFFSSTIKIYSSLTEEKTSIDKLWNHLKTNSDENKLREVLYKAGLKHLSPQISADSKKINEMGYYFWHLMCK